jgi:hypothetical protein
VVRVVEIVVIFVVTANTFFGDCRFLGGFIFLVTETSAKSAIEPDPAYSIPPPPPPGHHASAQHTFEVWALSTKNAPFFFPAFICFCSCKGPSNYCASKAK